MGIIYSQKKQDQFILWLCGGKVEFPFGSHEELKHPEGFEPEGEKIKKHEIRISRKRT